MVPFSHYDGTRRQNAKLTYKKSCASAPSLTWPLLITTRVHFQKRCAGAASFTHLCQRQRRRHRSARASRKGCAGATKAIAVVVAVVVAVVTVVVVDAVVIPARTSPPPTHVLLLVYSELNSATGFRKMPRATCCLRKITSQLTVYNGSSTAAHN